MTQLEDVSVVKRSEEDQKSLDKIFSLIDFVADDHDDNVDHISQGVEKLQKKMAKLSYALGDTSPIDKFKVLMTLAVELEPTEDLLRKSYSAYTQTARLCKTIRDLKVEEKELTQSVKMFMDTEVRLSKISSALGECITTLIDSIHTVTGQLISEKKQKDEQEVDR
jgi:hypothetical protein